jgi:hypothetical protein
MPSSKIRCDHRRPTCRRRDVRGLSSNVVIAFLYTNHKGSGAGTDKWSQCYYHPAPLTWTRKKPPLPWSEPLAPSPTDDNSPTLRNCTTARVSSQIATAPISQATYLGLTSFLASFHDNPCDLNLLTARSPNASVLRKTWSPDYTHRLTQLLQPLKLFEDFIRDCYQHSPLTVIPAPLIFNP